LLPHDRHEQWTGEPRRRLQSLHERLLRASTKGSGGRQARCPWSVSANHGRGSRPTTTSE
jgi:hypothetical protein